MEDKDKIITLKKVDTGKSLKPDLQKTDTKVTNPIAKKFIKFVSSSKGKFSIKDVFR